MPPSENLVVVCTACKRSYKYLPAMEGKSVRCKCGTKFLARPQERPNPSAAARSSNPKPQAPASPQNEASEEDAFSSMLASLDNGSKGKTVAAQSSVVCPGCQSPVAPNAVICVKCGTKLNSKRKGKAKTKFSAAKPQRTNEATPGLKVGGIGIAIHLTGLILAATAVAVFFYTTGQTQRGSRFSAEGSYTTLGMFVGGIAMIILGPLLCLAMPSRAGRGPLALGLTLFVAVAITPFLNGLSPHPAIPRYAISIFYFGAIASVLTFYRDLASYLEDALFKRITAILLGIFKTCLVFLVIILSIRYVPALAQVPYLPETSVIGFIALYIFISLGYLLTTAGMAYRVIRH